MNDDLSTVMEKLVTTVQFSLRRPKAIRELIKVSFAQEEAP
jgi:hypothetical protein